MAESRSIKERAGYESTVKSRGFQPIVAPDLSPQLRNNAQVEERNYQKLNEALSIEEKLQATADRLNLEEAKQLIPFAEGMGKLVKAGFEKKADEEIAKGKALAYKFGVPESQQKLYQEGVAKAREGHRVIQGMVADAEKDGEPAEVLEMFKSLSGYTKIGFTQAMAERAGKEHFNWINEQLRSNNTLIIKDRDGNEFTPAQVGNDPVRGAMALAKLNEEFFKVYGLTNVNNALLNEHTFPYMRENEGKLMNALRKQFSIERSAVQQHEYNEMLSTNGDVLAYIEGMQNTRDENGALLGKTGAWKAFWSRLTLLDEANQLSEQQIAQMKGYIDPDTKKSVGDRWAAQWGKFDKERSDRRRKDYYNSKAEDQIAFEKDELAAHRWLMENPGATSEEVLKIHEALSDKHKGKKSQIVLDWATERSSDAVAAKTLDKRFDQLYSIGALTTEQVRKAPSTVREKWMPRAIELEKQNAEMGKFTEHMNTLKNTVLKTVGVSQSNQIVTNLGEMVAGELQGKFRARTYELIRSQGMDPATAAQTAFMEVRQEYLSAQNDANNSYYFNKKEREFTNFLPASLKGTSKSVTAQNNKIRQAVKAQNRNALDQRDLILNRTELESIEVGYGTEGWRFSSKVLYWANELGVNPLELINRQRVAQGDMKPLATPAALEIVKGTISPSAQRLINSFGSPNRSTRALSQIREFKPEMIKGGFGQIIQSAARANGIEPGVLAGLLEVESKFDPMARSDAGAIGIAQIVPKWHPGVDPTDPIASINYAAKHLSELQRRFGGDMRLAALAYNAGESAIRQYNGPIPGSTESQEYWNKVTIAAAKYGYAQAWRDPGSMRPTIAYRIGNLGYGSTGPHLDLKRVDRGTSQTTGSVPLATDELDDFVEVQSGGQWLPLSKGTTITDNESRHRARGSYGMDYAADDGTPVRLKNGAQVVDVFKGDQGTDHMIIELPDGRRYQFLHGKRA